MGSLRVLALEHWRSDAFRVYGEVLHERGVAADCVHVDEDDLPDWREYDLIVALGGPMSVWEEAEHPWLVGEKRLVREAVAAGVPYFGVCFGSQLLASALGAEVYRGPVPELGLSPVFLTEEARRDPIFRGFPRDVEVFEWHRDAFDLPAGAVRLARSPRYGNQAMRVGRVAYGIQCHFEKSASDIAKALEMTPAFLDDLERRHGRGAVEEFLEGYAEAVPFLQETARQLLRRWLELASALGGVAADPRRPVMQPDRGTPIGRTSEQRQIEHILENVRDGCGAALVVRGDAGLGKTSLLEWAIQHASEFLVIRAAGAASDTEVPFAGLRSLCEPLSEHMAALPDEHARILGAAFEPEPAESPGDRFAVHNALCELLTAAARAKPIVVVVDDIQWLDEATAESLAFAVRSGNVPRTAFLLTAEPDTFVNLDAAELSLGPLDRASMSTILRTSGRELDPSVAEQLLDVAAGNPLTLLELTRTLTPAQRTGREDPLPVLHPRATAEEAFLHRIGRLPAVSRRAVLAAAVAGDATIRTLTRVGHALGFDLSAFRPAEAADLVTVTDMRVVFRHPLAKSAVVYNAPLADRQAVHAALGQVLVDESDADARAWHLARAAKVPDEDAAALLDAAARRAVGRRAYGTAARAYELASRVTPLPEAQATRLVSAAEAAFGAGHVSAALDHLDAARARASGSTLLTDIDHLRGRIAARTGSADQALSVLVAAAERCAHVDPGRAALILADAVTPCLRSGRPRDAAALAERAVDLSKDDSRPTRAKARLMYGTALIFTGNYMGGRELVGEAADLADGALTADWRAYLARSLRLAGYFERSRAVFGEVIDDAKAEGALGILPYALARLADLELESGDWAQAHRLLDEAVQIAEETGQGVDEGLARGTLAWLDAAQGRDTQCRANVEAASFLAARLGTGSQLDRTGLALGLLALGRRDGHAATSHLGETVRQQRAEGWVDAAVSPHVTPDLIEANLVSARWPTALRLLTDFETDAGDAGRPSALAVAARCRALLASGRDAERWFEQSLVNRHDLSPFEHARTRLHYARYLRCLEETDRARSEAAAALAAFESLGATPWVDQAQRELSSST